ncbi:MAG: hypothetical protein WCD46_04725 [Desulfobacterales bacterium]
MQFGIRGRPDHFAGEAAAALDGDNARAGGAAQIEFADGLADQRGFSRYPQPVFTVGEPIPFNLKFQR